MANMLEFYGDYLADPLFGLHLADTQDPDIFGSVMVLARSAPDFGTALEMLVEYLPILLSPEGRLCVEKTPDAVEIRWDTNTDFAGLIQPSVHGFLVTMKALQALAAQRPVPLYAGMADDLGRPVVACVQERIGCRIERSSENFVVFAHELLDVPVPTSNQMVFNVLRSAFSQLKRASEPSLHERVRMHLRAAIPAGRDSIEFCARRIGMPVRTLQKRIAKSGTHFSAIVEQEKMDLARKLLDTTDDSLLDIALQLGYSDQTCFGRAFKRCTGMTPRTYRERTIC